MSEEKTYPLRLPVELHRRLKLQAVREDRNMKEIIIEQIERYLEEVERE